MMKEKNSTRRRRVEGEPQRDYGCWMPLLVIDANDRRRTIYIIMHYPFWRVPFLIHVS